MPSDEHLQLASASFASYRGLVESRDLLKSRASKIFAPYKKEERVISYDEVKGLIQPGDGMWYSGRMPHSWYIRIVTVSSVSHGGLYDRIGDEVSIIESVEGHGIRRVPLQQALKAEQKKPAWLRGTYYWAPVNRYRYYDFDGVASASYAARYMPDPVTGKIDIGNGKYGRSAVFYESLFHVPGIRLIAYWRWHNRLDQALDDVQPYCSMLQVLSSIAGGQNPVPGVAPQLCSPQTTFQSLLWESEKLAIEL